MKICFVCANNFVHPGGIRTHIVKLSEELKSLGHETHIIAPKLPGKTSQFNTNIDNFHEVGSTMLSPMNGSYIDFSFSTNSEIQEIFDKYNFDIVHFHNFIPFVSTDSYFESSGSKRVITIHFFPNKNSQAFAKKQLIKRLSNLFDHTIFVSDAQNYMYDFLPKTDYSVIYNGITIDKKLPPKSITDKKKINLLFVGRFDPRKGLEYLIKAFKILSTKSQQKYTLHVAGGTKEDFQKRYDLDILGLDIVFYGALTDQELHQIRLDTDIYISPAIGGESFGYVLLEAMMYGIPILAFDNEGYRTVLKEKLTQSLVENKNIELLAQRIEELSTDEKLFSELSKFGLEYVNRYSWKNLAKDVLDVYHKVLNS